jgi:hypothetical protein
MSITLCAAVCLARTSSTLNATFDAMTQRIEIGGIGNTHWLRGSTRMQKGTQMLAILNFTGYLTPRFAARTGSHGVGGQRIMGGHDAIHQPVFDGTVVDCPSTWSFSGYIASGGVITS